jgi:hypothetical protein
MRRKKEERRGWRKKKKREAAPLHPFLASSLYGGMGLHV